MKRTIITLYNANNEEASLKDVLKWFIYTYPEDIFIATPKQIVEIREKCNELLNIIK